ncbi:energy transducer TonB [Flavobacterium sp. ACAM 123]|uniref:energy transducer TonB n=1 Tax=Flavobacterium sp. ACAM 123 TaxID=1189620 RepID=UPI000301BE57|nr:energy transducer TonB [Flavobacterium sp. ACAM 123]
MSKLSLYEANWMNLVFENKNKEYGAYQLRQESAKTSLFALFMGLLLCASLLSIPGILSLISPVKTTPALLADSMDQIITVTKIFPNEIKKIEKPVLSKVIEQKSAVIIAQKKIKNLTVVAASQATTDIATNIEISTAKPDSDDRVIANGTNLATSQGAGSPTPVLANYGNTVVTSALLDNLPEFPGGIAKFYGYIGKNFESSEISGERSIRIYVSFVVEKDGSMTEIKVKNDPGYGLGNEAVRVLKSIKTKWIPGMIGSMAVRTSYHLPIIVQMN